MKKYLKKHRRTNKVIASKITKSAKGENCQIRLEGICNFNNETTVFAHINGAGMGMKQKDLFGSYSCSSCHDAVDGRLKTRFQITHLKLSHYEGMKRTQEILLKKGLIKI